MALFIALGRSTDDGLRNIADLTTRHNAAVERVEAAGVKVLGSYAVMGRYDYVVILDAADVGTCIRVLTKEASGGNIRYETMPAIATGEFGSLLS
jgi:uncharacterized protein with GYD domain